MRLLTTEPRGTTRNHAEPRGTTRNHAEPRGTTRKYATSLKRILGMLELPASFVKSLRLVPSQRPQPVVALGKFTRLRADDPVRLLLEAWVEILRRETRNQSSESVRAIVRFVCNSCLPALGLDLERWPEDPVAHVVAWIADRPAVLEGIVGQGAGAKEKATRLQFFLKHILGADIAAPRVPPKRPRGEMVEGDDDCGRDMHRISSEHLELIHNEARKDLLDELVFMILLTTGLRVGSLPKITIENVADARSGKYAIRSEGRTQEKGHKMASFVLCPDVKRLILAWLRTGRPADTGPYLFPGAGAASHFGMSNIRRRLAVLCRRCGLQGTPTLASCLSVGTVLILFRSV
jgi:hypothetical protein